jgi:hypothetical protein
MMVAVARHIDNVPESRTYYDKKRTEGKTHNQAVRALGRHLIRASRGRVFTGLSDGEPACGRID